MARCDSESDARRIVLALSGNPVKASLSDAEIIAKLDRVLAKVNGTKSAPDTKIRVVL